MVLLPGQRTLLVKVLGMTGSEHDGEALAAVRKAHGIISAAGLSWDSVIAPAQADDPPPPDDDDEDDEDDEDDTATRDATIEWCLSCGGDVVTDWERDFLVSLQSYSRLSEKQRKVLDRIVAKCQRAQR